jgi:hypothetical protein
MSGNGSSSGCARANLDPDEDPERPSRWRRWRWSSTTEGAVVSAADDKRLRSLRDQAEQREAQHAATRQQQLKREFYERQGMFDWQIPGADLSPHELYLEELDQPPSRLLSSSAPAADRVPSRGTGPDRIVGPTRTRPAVASDPAAGHTFKEAA